MSVIKGGTLVTGDGKTVIKNAYVRFENDLIVDFGEGECPTTDNDVIDAAGCVVMPGVIDHHIHDGPAVSQRREAALQREGEFTPQEAAGTGNHHDP